MASCAICKEAGELELLAGFPACMRCRSGDPLPGIRAQGFKSAVNVHKFSGQSGGAGPEHMLHVVVRRPTELEVAAILRPSVTFIRPPMPWWRRLTWKPDPDDPNQKRELEVELEVDPLDSAVVERLAADPGVRKALQLLAPLDSDVQIGFVEDAIKVSRTAGEPLPQGDDVLRAMMLLSMHRLRLTL